MATDSNVLKIKERMISARDLRERWPGLNLRGLIQRIEERIFSDSALEEISKFPEPFYHISTTYQTRTDNRSDKEIFKCKKCILDISDKSKNFRPYKERNNEGKTQYYLKRTLFKLAEVKEYESLFCYIRFDQELLEPLATGSKSSTNEARKLTNDSVNPHLPISQRYAAEMCGKSPSTIRNWDKGLHRPDGYPGRYSSEKFLLWLGTYLKNKKLIEQARRIRHAIPTDPNKIALFATKSVFDENDYDEESVYGL